MNKFIFFALMALVAVARANEYEAEQYEDEYESQTSLSPSNSEETDALQGNQKLFADFCIQSRDYVINSVKYTTNGGAAKVFQFVFNTVGSVGREALDTQKMATDRLAEQIANPSAQIADAANEIEQVVVDGQKKIQQEQTQPKTFVQAFVSTVQATRNAVSEKFQQGLSQISRTMAVSELVNMLESACNQVAKYEQVIKQQFEEAKKEVAVNDPSAAKYTFESIPCVTARRVVRMDGVCKLAKAAQSPVMKLLTTAKRS